jgi:ABC-2 type transport system permease protein
MKPAFLIMRRELAEYFATPIAYVVLVIFLGLANILPFVFGQLFERNQADMGPFFYFLPWLYVFLAPAISMRLWAEERRNGTIELLLTQPITLWQAVCGKFLAAWLFVGIALALTFPLWITINYLGNPDNGAIVAAYLGCFFIAGGFLAVGSLASSITRNQVIAFLVGFVFCFMLMIIGFPMVIDLVAGILPQWLLDGIASLSFYSHFENIIKGVLDLRDVLYYALATAFFLLASTVVLESRKSK